MRSSLSAEEAQNQKLYLGAEIGFYFINSCILGAYYMKSYKKCSQKVQYLEITYFTMGIWVKYRDFARNLYYFQMKILGDFHIIRPIPGRPSERGDQDVSEYV